MINNFDLLKGSKIVLEKLYIMRNINEKDQLPG